jgi:phosphatidylglycerophosphate synthase
MADRPRYGWFWMAQALSLARVGLTFVFIVLSPWRHLWAITVTVYLAALTTDLLDGRLARARGVATRFGGATDAFGDRYFSVVSLVYAASRGLNLAVIGIIIARDLYALSLRLIFVDGQRLLYGSSKMTGAVLIVIAAGTSNLLCHPDSKMDTLFEAPYVCVALFYAIYLPWSLKVSFQRFRHLVSGELEGAPPTD